MTGASQVTFTVCLESGGGIALEQAGGGFHKSVPPAVVSRSSLLRQFAELSDESSVLVAPSGFVEAWLQFVEDSYAALADKSDQGLAETLLVRSRSTTSHRSYSTFSIFEGAQTATSAFPPKSPELLVDLTWIHL
jgi:hypothetical protein